MKKILAIAFPVAAIAALAFANPAQAEHGTEGTITVAGVEACSGEDATPADGKCTWVSTDPGGWIGTGPFTITWADPVTEEVIDSFTCDLGQRCDSTGDDVDPIPADVLVTSDGYGPGGGTFAAGDADQHNDE